MANRSYPQFGKVKTIVLPIPIESLTIAEYKEKYGIDLKEFVYCSPTGGVLQLKNLENANILLKSSSFDFLRNIVLFYRVAHDEGISDGIIRFFCESTEDGATALQFRIDQDSDFVIDNLLIEAYEF